MNKPLSNKFELLYSLVIGTIDDMKTIEKLLTELEEEVINNSIEFEDKIDQLSNEVDSLEQQIRELSINNE